MTEEARQTLEIFRMLVRDAEEILGLEPGCLKGDLEVVSCAVKSRGFRVFLLDLPNLCSDLQSSLERGYYVCEKTSFLCKNGFPRIFAPIYSQIFTADWDVKISAEPEAVRCLRQVLRTFKSFEHPCPKSSIKEKIREFEEIEACAVTPSLSWGDDSLRSNGLLGSLCDFWQPHSRGEADGSASCGDGFLLQDLSAIQYVADRVLRPFSVRPAWFIPRHGPGAVSERVGSSKYEFPTWPDRLESKFPYLEWGVVNPSFWDRKSYAGEQSPAKLIDVPKDFSGPRLIASEPVSAQFVQQGLMNVLRKNVLQSVLRHCIDFKSQEPSRELALAASVDRGLSTIDLSSASDRLSCAVVERLFRRNFSFLESLNAARTPEVLLPDGQILRMKKFAAQGAAFTFPIQSIAYAIICMGVVFSTSQLTKLADLAREVRVFGDDLIVPSYAYSRVCNVLEVLGLKVNRQKSFHKGFFRESCGMNAFRGADVTSASVRCYFKARQPASLVSVLECANNLFLKGFINASNALLETIPYRYRKGIPYVRPGDSVMGVLSSSRRTMRTRYNGSLHRTEHLCLVVENKVKKTTIDGHHRLMQWFVENPCPESVWISGEVVGVKARYRLRWVPDYMFGSVA